jgi:gas vesicle protein
VEPLTWAFIGTVIGAVVGAGTSILTTVITSSNARKLQQSASILERFEKAREFQRNNLLNLQETLSVGMRLIVRAHLFDTEQFQKSEMDRRISLLPEELNQELLNSSRQLSILSERVSDDPLRKSIKSLRQSMTDVLMSRTEQESFAAIKVANTLFEETMGLLGKVLRENY